MSSRKNQGRTDRTDRVKYGRIRVEAETTENNSVQDFETLHNTREDKDIKEYISRKRRSF